MPNGVVDVESTQIIASRIGPIFDPKFLMLIPHERLKDIVIIQLNAQVKAMQEEVKGIERIARVIKETQLE